jgi:hypothetical protein
MLVCIVKGNAFTKEINIAALTSRNLNGFGIKFNYLFT